MNREAPPLLVVAGSTATGKTAVGVELARCLGGEVVSADSVQVYRGFDIGSAKPTAEEQHGIRHHLIDILEPEESIDAAQYAAQADQVIQEILSRGHVPVVVGGAGLWLRALLRGLVPLPPVDVELRRHLEEEAHSLGDEALHQRLAQADPVSANRLHVNDRLRVTRALEVVIQTGKPLSSFHDEHALGEPRYRATFAVLERDREDLRKRIDLRINAMMERGWLAEVTALLGQHGPGVRAFRSIGYRQLAEHVTRGTTLEDALRRVRRATWLYARRQRTWFCTERGVTWRGGTDQLLGNDRDMRAALLGGVTGTRP